MKLDRIEYIPRCPHFKGNKVKELLRNRERLRYPCRDIVVERVEIESGLEA